MFQKGPLNELSAMTIFTIYITISPSLGISLFIVTTKLDCRMPQTSYVIP